MNNNISPIQYDNNVKYIDTNNERGSNNEIMPTQIGIFQHKLASKKTKITSTGEDVEILEPWCFTTANIKLLSLWKTE